MIMISMDEAVKILRGGHCGILEWNRLRKYPLRTPTLMGLNLYLADLCGVNFSQSDVQIYLEFSCSMRFEYMDISRAILINTKLREANFRWANLSYTKLCGSDLYNTNFLGANLYKTDFRGVKNFSYAQLKVAKNFEFSILDPENSML